MPSIKVLDHRGGGQRKRTLWGLMGSLKLKIWKIHIGSPGVLFIIPNGDNLEPYVAEDVKQRVKDEGFEILNPPEIRAARSIVMHQLDDQIRDFTEAEIRDNINQTNRGLECREVVKIPTVSHMIKARFRNTEMARQALLEGLFVLDQNVPPRMIVQEAFVRLTPCTACFNYHHIRKECPHKDRPRCNKCAGYNHVRKNCRSNFVKCLNCEGPHETLAKECEIRKRIIKERSKDERKKMRDRARNTQKTYSEAAKRAKMECQARGGAGKAQSNLTPLPANAFATILTAIVLAREGECKKPGSFQNTMNKMYQANNIPNVIIPDGLIEDLGLNSSPTCNYPPGEGAGGGGQQTSQNNNNNNDGQASQPRASSPFRVIPMSFPVTVAVEEEFIEDDEDENDLFEDMDIQSQSLRPDAWLDIKRKRDDLEESFLLTPGQPETNQKGAPEKKLIIEGNIDPPILSQRDPRRRPEDQNKKYPNNEDIPEDPQLHHATPPPTEEGARRRIQTGNVKWAPTSSSNGDIMEKLSLNLVTIGVPKTWMENKVSNQVLLGKILNNETLVSHGNNISTKEVLYLIDKASRIMGDEIVAKLGVDQVPQEIFEEQMNKRYGGAAARPPKPEEQPGPKYASTPKH